MRSIIIYANPQPPISILLFPQSDLQPHFPSVKSIWPSKPYHAGQVSSNGFQQMHELNRKRSLTARVGLFLAATPPPRDFTVLFQTSAVMLFMYWIANFVVPRFIMKDLQADKTDEDGKDEEDSSENGQGSTQAKRTPRSGQREKRGFGSTKQS